MKQILVAVSDDKILLEAKDGMKVYYISTLQQYVEHAIVLIAVSDKYRKVMEDNLYNMDFKNIKRFDFNIFSYYNIDKNRKRLGEVF